MKPGYYSEKLAGERLRECYDLAPARVKAYLEAEIGFVLQRTSRTTVALELGCGYGRALRPIAPRVKASAGIDTSFQSIKMAQEFVGSAPSLSLFVMDATRTGFADHAFDLTFCIQNGISAFAVDELLLLKEAIRVTRSGGIVLFSSYSDRFWEHRLEWFELQAARDLIGEIDHKATGNGVIVCKDGFRARTLGPADFERFAADLGLVATITEVDGSSLFCEVIAP